MTEPNKPAPLRLSELTPGEARATAAANPRLVLPVGTNEQHGEHLPLSADTIVVERLADDLSAEFRVLRAPPIEYGVNDPIHGRFSGGATVRRKTLRRTVNDLLVSWEQLGITEILVLTMNAYAPHMEALGTVIAKKARIRVLDILAMDFGGLVEHPEHPIHGGEVDTSLLLYLRPDLVRMSSAVDHILSERHLRRYRRGTRLSVPEESSGSIGHASKASADKGRQLYEFILNRVRERVFLRDAQVRTG